jgi:hypothetical protein
MAYLNKDQRDQLKAELEKMSFGAANGRLKRMDRKGRLAFYRNAQRVGQWQTKHILAGFGTEVTLIESNQFKEKLGKANRVKNDYKLVEVVVEPTSDNRN